MNAIAKNLSQGIRVQLGVCIPSMKINHEKWQLEDDLSDVLGEYD